MYFPGPRGVFIWNFAAAAPATWRTPPNDRILQY
jgi:hypothetical protein